MATRFHISLGILSMGLLAASASVAAQAPGTVNGKQPRAAAPATISVTTASPKERGQLTRQFVMKWGPYVQRVYNVPVGIWAKRMVPNFATADASNFRNALKRETYEGAMAELGGTGHRLNDNQAIDRLAKAASGADAAKANAVAAKFGDLNQDLVYTPIQPCRIVDTRNTPAGAIPANSTRSFLAINSSNYTSQGGSATNCGTLGLLNATAVAINVTAVTPVANGYATVYPFNTTQPLSSNVNYYTSITAANGVIAQIPNPLASFDFTIYSNAQSHYVVDISGYFAPPLATALQCVETANTIVNNIPAGGTANAVAPVCATGYTQTATNCESSDWLVPFVFFHHGTCSARNNSTAVQEIRASRTCCRVPGR